MSAGTGTMLSVIFAGLSALGAIITTLIAAWALRETRKDSRDRTRPVLIAQLRRAVLSHGTLDLVIANHGASSAHDVTVTFDPQIESAEALPDSDMRKWIAQRYSSAIPQWPPGMTYSNVYRAGHDAVAPTAVTIAYLGQDGTRYADRFNLDPEPLLKETQATPSNPTADKRLTKALEEIARSLDRLA